MKCLDRSQSSMFIFLTSAVAVFGILNVVCHAHVYHVDHTDEEIRGMDIETLLHVESDLRQQNSAVDKHVASLHGRVDKLHFSQQQLENKHKKVDAAKDWETRQKISRAKELDHAMAEMEAKRLQTRLLSEEGAKLRKEIHELERKTQFLHQEERALKERYSHPSLTEVVMNEAEKMGSVPEHLANKTVESIFPELRMGLKEAGFVQKRLESFSGLSTLLISLCVYILGLSLLCLIYRCVRHLQKMLTLPRMLFTIDMAFVLMWCLVLLCFGTILQDPLQIMASNHVALSIVIQIFLMSSLIGNVFMRCVFVSTNFKAWSFVELFGAIFVAQHYYQAVWVPFLLDQGMKSSGTTYTGYLVVHCTLGIYRARSIGKAQNFKRKGWKLEKRSFPDQGDWFKHKLETAVQGLEDFLTAERIVSKTDFEALTDDHSADSETAFRQRWEGTA